MAGDWWARWSVAAVHKDARSTGIESNTLCPTAQEPWQGMFVGAVCLRCLDVQRHAALP